MEAEMAGWGRVGSRIGEGASAGLHMGSLILEMLAHI